MWSGNICGFLARKGDSSMFLNPPKVSNQEYGFEVGGSGRSIAAGLTNIRGVARRIGTVVGILDPAGKEYAVQAMAMREL